MDASSLHITVKPTKLIVNTSGSTLISKSGDQNLVLRNKSQATIVINKIQNSLNFKPQKLQLITAGFQGPEGAPGKDAVGGSLSWDVEIPAGTSRVVDTFATSDGQSHWSITFASKTSNLSGSYQISGNFSGARGEYDFTKYAISGDRLPHKSQFSSTGASTTHTITNNSLQDIVITLVKN